MNVTTLELLESSPSLSLNLYTSLCLSVSLSLSLSFSCLKSVVFGTGRRGAGEGFSLFGSFDGVEGCGAGQRRGAVRSGR